MEPHTIRRVQKLPSESVLPGHHEATVLVLHARVCRSPHSTNIRTVSFDNHARANLDIGVCFASIHPQSSEIIRKLTAWSDGFWLHWRNTS